MNQFLKTVNEKRRAVPNWYARFARIDGQNLHVDFAGLKKKSILDGK